MRIAYLDEAGTSDLEPIAVVAAVVIEADLQWRPLGEALSQLADACAPEDHRAGFIFHAKELWSGGKTLTRDRFPPEHGRGFLKSLVHIPWDNGMPVFMGWVVKAEMKGPFIPPKAVERSNLYQTMAFIGAVVGIEQFMRNHFPHEVCQLVAEDHPTAKRMIRDAHNFLRTPESASTLPDEMKGLLPLQHIIDTVHFAAKTESSPLQLADASAFVIRRHLEGRPDAAEYYDILAPALLSRPKTDFPDQIA